MLSCVPSTPGMFCGFSATLDVSFVSCPPNGLSFFWSEHLSSLFYSSASSPGHFVTGVGFFRAWLFEIGFPFVSSKSSARSKISVIIPKRL